MKLTTFWSDQELVSTPSELNWLRVCAITRPVTVWPSIIMPLFEFDEELVFELLLALLFEVVAWDDCLLAAELF